MTTIPASAALAILLMISNQASGQADPYLADSPHRPFITTSQTATKNAPDSANPKLPVKPKLLRSNPHRFVAIRIQNIDPMLAPDDEDVLYDRRRAFRLDRENQLDLDDRIKYRLFLARARALEKFHKIHQM